MGVVEEDKKNKKNVEVGVEVVEVVFDVCSTLSLTPDGIWIWNTPGIFKSIFKLGVMPIFSHISKYKACGFIIKISGWLRS